MHPPEKSYDICNTNYCARAEFMPRYGVEIIFSDSPISAELQKMV